MSIRYIVLIRHGSAPLIIASRLLLSYLASFWEGLRICSSKEGSLSVFLQSADAGSAREGGSCRRRVSAIRLISKLRVPTVIKFMFDEAQYCISLQARARKNKCGCLAGTDARSFARNHWWCWCLLRPCWQASLLNACYLSVAAIPPNAIEENGSIPAA